MKNPLKALVLGILISSILTKGICAEDQHDIRDVSGRTVDLQPLHDWLAKAPHDRGPRPLPFWHELHIVDIMIPMNTDDQCMLAADDGRQIKAYLYQLDYSLRTPFVTFYTMNHHIPELNRQIAQDEAVVRGLNGKNNSTARAERDAAQQRLVDARRDLGESTQKRDLSRHMMEKAKTIPFLAMSAGTTYTDPANGQKLEVWTCGIRKATTGIAQQPAMPPGERTR